MSGRELSVGVVVSVVGVVVVKENDGRRCSRCRETLDGRRGRRQDAGRGT